MTIQEQYIQFLRGESTPEEITDDTHPNDETGNKYMTFGFNIGKHDSWELVIRFDQYGQISKAWAEQNVTIVFFVNDEYDLTRINELYEKYTYDENSDEGHNAWMRQLDWDWQKEREYLRRI